MAAVAYSAPAPTVERLYSLRRRLELAVETAIAALDQLDGDPDMEDIGDSEPSLAHPESRAWESQVAVSAWLSTSGTGWTDLEEPTGDDEPEIYG
ncbi:MAG: hypothetical protein DCF28_13555 [Alphaproteobacteria bacterium]|nr:MAG: hypothetical protein DCF28_13555 [Alphaproteobacteria bacterium]PZO36597.1 MAG: hypothetical protein DCE92_08735 [Alphaproteobacteria bacterium]